MPGVENRMVAGFWMPPQTQPQRECSCGSKAYKSYNGEPLCYHHWCQAVAEHATQEEKQRYLSFSEEAEDRFAHYVEDSIRSGAYNWTDFIIAGFYAVLSDRNQAEITAEYFRDCDQSAFAEQIEKWRNT